MFGTLHMRGGALVVAVALTAYLCASASAAGLASSAVRSNPVTFTNTNLAANAAADIATVVVNNDAGGQITVQVNFARPLTNTDSVAILVDADQNPATGSQNLGGVDYVLSDDQSSHTWDLEQWSGTDWTPAASYSTVRVTGGSGTSQLTFSVNRTEIGVTAGFNFWVDSMNGNGGAGFEAQAPASNWNYQLQADTIPAKPGSPLELAVVATVAPATTRAGGIYTVGMLVQRSDTLGFLGAEGQVECRATLRGKTLPAPVSTVVTMTHNGVKVSVPMCAWQIPAGARGARLHGTIRVSYQGAQVARQFSARIR